MVDEKAGVKKLEELLDEVTEGIRNAKTEEEVELLKKKVEIVEDLIEAYEGDKDLEKIPAIMDKVGDMMEDLLEPLKELLNELYSPERVQAMGRSVAEFYKNLAEAGMDKDAALELTKEYMDAINPGKKLMEMLGGVLNHGKEEGRWVPETNVHGSKGSRNGGAE
ncbi:hypothetical protein [Thermococcus sp.]|uniref:hypothetical protein n=1 Tax=Thermococcus sp. TaxID=35749 RepID=UPI00261CF34E|nr:hypothetical protein [Thermococcus sp.]